MRTLQHLVVADDALPGLAKLAAASPNTAEILPADPGRGAATLLALQVTTRSTLGALAYHTSGISIASGWLRHLGCGGDASGDGLREWNASLGGIPLDPPLEGALLVAYDAVGGFFAVNAGAWTTDPGTIHYLEPDTQSWQSLGFGHGAFVAWSMSLELDDFYAPLRWPGWSPSGLLIERQDQLASTTVERA